MKIEAGFKVDRKAARDAVRRELRQIDKALTDTGVEVVEVVKGYSGGTDEDGRLLHPGKWGDRTGELKAGYAHEIVYRGYKRILRLSNDVWYASLLEAKAGMWVLRGIGGAGGILQKRFAAAMKRYAPHVKLRS